MDELIPITVVLILAVLRWLKWHDEREIRRLADEAAAKFAEREP